MSESSPREGARQVERAIRSVTRRAPRPLLNAMRRVRRDYRRTRFRVRERVRPVSLTAVDVECALRDCGLGKGDAMFFQASMSVFGSFADGPATVLQGIERVLGLDGLVAMPAFPIAGPAIQHLDADPVFDVREASSRMGAISETFRTLPGTFRSIHPTHSISARGPGAEEVVTGHERAETPFGEGTPFVRLVERDAMQVFFGCGTGPLTMYHAFECIREPAFPLDVFADRAFEARCVGRNGEDLRVHTLVHDPRFLPDRIDSNPRLQALFRRELIQRGVARSVTLGRAEILAIRLQAMLSEFERLLREGITIYERKLPAEQPVLKPQQRVRG
jgi:aminoglycoside 3-N-acetyltransferase